LGAANDWREALDCAGKFVKVIAKLPASQRNQLAENFNDLLAERDLNNR
jgi:hypothetical protein